MAPSDKDNKDTKGTPPAALRIRLKYPDVDTFVEKYSSHVTRTQLFLTTKSPKPVGTTVRFELLAADGAKLLKGEGTVVAIREGNGRTPGMTLKFGKLDTDSKKLVDRIVAHRRALGQNVSGVPAEVDGEGSGPIVASVVVAGAAAGGAATAKAAMGAPTPDRTEETDAAGDGAAGDGTAVDAAVAAPVEAVAPAAPASEQVAAAPANTAPKTAGRVVAEGSTPGTASPSALASVDVEALIAADGPALEAMLDRARAIARAAWGDAPPDGDLARLLERDPAPPAATITDASRRLGELGKPRRTQPSPPFVAPPSVAAPPVAAPPVAAPPVASDPGLDEATVFTSAASFAAGAHGAETTVGSMPPPATYENADNTVQIALDAAMLGAPEIDETAPLAIGEDLARVAELAAALGADELELAVRDRGVETRGGRAKTDGPNGDIEPLPPPPPTLARPSRSMHVPRFPEATGEHASDPVAARADQADQTDPVVAPADPTGEDDAMFIEPDMADDEPAPAAAAPLEIDLEILADEPLPGEVAPVPQDVAAELDAALDLAIEGGSMDVSEAVAGGAETPEPAADATPEGDGSGKKKGFFKKLFGK